MNIFTICPCCSYPMLRHINNKRCYWFCRHCWQEMPDLTAETNYNQSPAYLSTRSLSLNKSKTIALV